MGRIYQRYLVKEIAFAIIFVLLALLTIVVVMRTMSELRSVNNVQYDFIDALYFIVLRLPGFIYDLLPICVLIGGLSALTMLTRQRELIVLLTHGMAIAKLVWLLILVGLLFALAIFLLGEFVVPNSELAARQFKLQLNANQTIKVGDDNGLWLRQDNAIINIQAIDYSGKLHHVYVYELDDKLRLQRLGYAQSAYQQADKRWRLVDFKQSTLSSEKVTAFTARDFAVELAIPANFLRNLFIKPQRLSALNLYRYIDYLTENKIDARRYKVYFWQKMLYPFITVILAVLAIPFSLNTSRTVHVGSRIFIGIMIGIVIYALIRLSSVTANLTTDAPVWLITAITVFVSTLFTLAMLAVMLNLTRVIKQINFKLKRSV